MTPADYRFFFDCVELALTCASGWFALLAGRWWISASKVEIPEFDDVSDDPFERRYSLITAALRNSAKLNTVAAKWAYKSAFAACAIFVLKGGEEAWSLFSEAFSRSGH